MPKLHNTVHIDASPDDVWAVLGDLAGVGAWISGITDVHVEAHKRVCTFANGSVQHEEIHDYSSEKRSYRYTIEGGPLPLKVNRGSFAIEEDGEGALVVWDAEVEVLSAAQEAEVTQMLDGAYKQTLESLRQLVESRSRRNAAPPQVPAEELFGSVAETFLGDPGITGARMFGAQGLKIGGKVFAMLANGKLVVKLPKERVDALIAAGDGEPFDPGHGRLMKEWVAVGPGAKDDWLSLAGEAKDFVAPGPQATDKLRVG